MDENELEEAMAETVEKSFDDNELQDIMSEIESLEKEFVEAPAEGLGLDVAKDNVLQEAIDAEVAQMGAEDPVAEVAAEDSVAEIAAGPIAEAEPETIQEEVTLDPVADIESEIADIESESTEVADADFSSELEDEIDAVLDVETEEVKIEPEMIHEDNVVAFEPRAVSPVSDSSVGEGSQMDFNASGTMNLNLNFAIGGQTANLVVSQEAGLSVTLNGVELHINEESGCSVELPGGIKFSIPLTDTAVDSKKNAA